MKTKAQLVIRFNWNKKQGYESINKILFDTSFHTASRSLKKYQTRTSLNGYGILITVILKASILDGVKFSKIIGKVSCCAVKPIKLVDD